MGKGKDGNEWFTEDYWKGKREDYQEYIKKNPIKRSKEDVQQRTKKSPITVKRCFSSIHRELEGARLTVTATPGDWKKVESFAHNYPGFFGAEFHSSFANPAVLRICEKNKPRGKQTRQIQVFANDIKIQSGILYEFISSWCGKTFREWPKYLKRIMEMAEKEGHEDVMKREIEDGYQPKELTAYIMDKVYGEPVQKIGLKPLFEYKDRDSIENFYITYIQGKKKAREVIKKLMDGKTPREIEALAYTVPALKLIFSTLEVL